MTGGSETGGNLIAGAEDDRVPAFISEGGYLKGGVLYPISVQRAADNARLTALLDDIDEASRRSDDNPTGFGLFQILSNQTDYATLADRLERGRDWLKAHYATGTLQCPSDREA